MINHPFIDGNKRMGYILMRLTLGEYGFDINVKQEEAYKFVIKVAEGKFDIDEITSWIGRRLVKNVL